MDTNEHSFRAESGGVTTVVILHEPSFLVRLAKIVFGGGVSGIRFYHLQVGSRTRVRPSLRGISSGFPIPDYSSDLLSRDTLTGDRFGLGYYYLKLSSNRVGIATKEILSNLTSATEEQLSEEAMVKVGRDLHGTQVINSSSRF